MANEKYEIIFANDITNSPDALQLIRQTAPFLGGVKMGITTTIVDGIGLIGDVRDILDDVDPGKKILADYKIADIGHWDDKGKQWDGTNRKIIERLAEAGADYVTCHTFPGITSIQECIDVGKDVGIGTLTLPWMTHKGAEVFFAMPIDKNHVQTELDALGHNLDISRCSTISDVILELGEYFGVDGYIGPANKPAILDNYARFTEKPVWAPGVGRQDTLGRSTEKQMEEYILKTLGMTGSKFIIGSLIQKDQVYNEGNPAKAAEYLMMTRDNLVKKLF